MYVQAHVYIQDTYAHVELSDAILLPHAPRRFYGCGWEACQHTASRMRSHVRRLQPEFSTK